MIKLEVCLQSNRPPLIFSSFSDENTSSVSLHILYLKIGSTSDVILKATLCKNLLFCDLPTPQFQSVDLGTLVLLSCSFSSFCNQRPLPDVDLRLQSACLLCEVCTESTELRPLITDLCLQEILPVQPKLHSAKNRLSLDEVGMK